MRNYYIFKSGRVSRKDNTVFFEHSEGRVPIPVTDIDSIFLFGEVDLNTKALNFFSQNHIIVHFFNYYGYYSGTFYPREFLNAGDLLVKQSAHYLRPKKRIVIAREFIKGAVYGMIQNLKRYDEQTSEILKGIERLKESIDVQEDVPSLMGIEGNIRELYYRAFPMIIRQKIEFEKRVKNPPDNMMNALISFVNSLVYTETLKQIYRTQLNPTISYLHEPFYRRFSLSLDIAEIFKPIYGDRIIFDLLNNRKISKEQFDRDLNYAYLKESGRKVVIQAFDEKLKTTVVHRQLKKKISYGSIIRLEAYKLIKHILGEQTYKSFKIWW